MGNENSNSTQFGFKKYLLKKNLKKDIPASIVVFLVALPLCLGIALASGAPLFAGLIAGVVGGIVVASISGSQLSVSGPAAGLTVIVLNSITELGSYQIFLVAVMVAGVMQVILGVLKAGTIGNYDNCSFNSEGFFTFRGNEKSNPVIGEKEKLHTGTEIKIEVIFEISFF